ncbi:MAG: hypothetical protein ACXVXC_07980 [Nocardioidaceae bacterium]
MSSSPQASATTGTVERFKPTNGYVIGYVSLAVVVGGVVWIAVDDPTLAGLRIALGMLFAGVLIYATQIRPRARIDTAGTLVLKNTFRDTHVPLVLVDAAKVSQALVVYVGAKRYVCIGIGKPIRKELRRSRRSTVFGGSRVSSLVDFGEHAQAAAGERNVTYETWVAQRIEELAGNARKELHGGTPTGEVRRTVAWPELAAALVTGVLFVVTLFL